MVISAAAEIALVITGTVLLQSEYSDNTTIISHTAKMDQYINKYCIVGKYILLIGFRSCNYPARHSFWTNKNHLNCNWSTEIILEILSA